MKEITIFYENKMYWEDTYKEYINFPMVLTDDVYDNAYIFYCHLYHRTWYRMSGAPILLNYVPKKLRALVLILT